MALMIHRLLQPPVAVVAVLIAGLVGVMLVVSPVPATATVGGGAAPGSAAKAAQPPCTAKALKRAVSGKVLSRRCAGGWAAGAVRLAQADRKGSFIVRARNGRWVALTATGLARACAPNSPVPRQVFKLSPCSGR